MNEMQTRKLNGLQRMNRRMTLNPLLRTRIIWWTRIWVTKFFATLGMIVEAIIKTIVKIILVIMAALFLL
jgi:hypothetical protein